MPNWNTGSISTHVGTLVGWGNIPTGVSGTTFDNLVEQEIINVENFANVSIDSSNIPETYQSPITDLTHAKILVVIDSSEGADTVKLEGLSVSQSQGSNADLAKQLREDALNKLKQLTKKVSFKRVIGGI